MAVFVVVTETSNDHCRFVVVAHGHIVRVIVTSTASVVKKWIRRTLYLHNHHRNNHLVVGMGVEWTPWHFAAATLQLCVGHRCLIYQLRHSPPVPNLLRRFLLDPRHTFVGLWNHFDAESLRRSDHSITMFRNPIDMRHHAVSQIDGKILSDYPIETIVREYLGMDVQFDVEVSRSDWGRNYLDGRQIMQATMDAYCSYLIGLRVRAWQL